MKHIPQLDGLRFFAMIGIFLNHCVFLKKNELAREIFEDFLHYGGLYVEIFIILSGFFAAYTCYNVKWNKYTYSIYIKKKAVRLFPVHIFCCLCYFIALYQTKAIELSFMNAISALSTLLLLQSLSPYTWSFLNAPSWTISTLWILYLLVPILIYTAKKINHRYIVHVMLGIGFTYSLICAIFFHINNNTVWFFYIFPFTRLISFFEGVLLAHLICSGSSINLKKHLTGLEIVTFAVIAVIVFLLRDGYFVILPLLLLLYELTVGGGKISKILSSKWLVAASQYSFSFYLIHYTVIMIGTVYFSECIDFGSLLLLLLVTMITTFILSVPIYKLVEKRLGWYLTTKLFKTK